MLRFSLRSVSKFLAATVVFAGSIGFAQAATSWSASYSGCSSGTVYASVGAWGSVGCANETAPIDTNVAGLSWKYSSDSYTPPPTSPTVISSATTATASSVVSWGSNGLGVYARGNTNETHTVDNSNKYVDSIVLQFNQAVTMNELSIGWKDGDADITVFAWTGATPSSANPAPTSLTGGWTSVAQLSDVSVGGYTSFTSNTSSSYWLVAALGGDTHVDSFKLLSVAGIYGGTTPPGGSTPEPGSLALLGLGAAGLLAARRRATVQL